MKCPYCGEEMIRGYPGKGQPLQPNFTNTTHFYKCFKEHYHMTPKQFRNAFKNK